MRRLLDLACPLLACARTDADVQIGWWGNMGGPAQKGMLVYCTMSQRRSPLTRSALSPYRAQPMKGMFKDGLFHGARRLGHLAPYVIPPFLIGWGIMKWAKVSVAATVRSALRCARCRHRSCELMLTRCSRSTTTSSTPRQGASESRRCHFDLYTASRPATRPECRPYRCIL